MKDFFKGFEKRAFIIVPAPLNYSATFPLEGQENKDRYIKDHSRSGALVGGALGAIVGAPVGGSLGAATTIRNPRLNPHGRKLVGAGAALGALGVGGLSALLAKRMEEKRSRAHADAGVGAARGRTKADAIVNAKKYMK